MNYNTKMMPAKHTVQKKLFFVFSFLCFALPSAYIIQFSVLIPLWKFLICEESMFLFLFLLLGNFYFSVCLSFSNSYMIISVCLYYVLLCCALSLSIRNLFFSNDIQEESGSRWIRRQEGTENSGGMRICTQNIVYEKIIYI